MLISAQAFPISKNGEIIAIIVVLLIRFFIKPSIAEKNIMKDDNVSAEYPASLIEPTKLNLCFEIKLVSFDSSSLYGKIFDVIKIEKTSDKSNNKPSLAFFNIPIPTALITKASDGLFASPISLSSSF